MLTLGPRADNTRGFLIDLDMAVETASLTPSTAPHRTGTREFMAIEILRGHQILHTYRHDLESFFYVFVWISVYGHWWHRNRDTPIRDWARGSMHQSAMSNSENMRRGAPVGWQTVEMHFEEWAEGLKEVADRWRRVLFAFGGGEGVSSWLGRRMRMSCMSRCWRCCWRGRECWMGWNCRHRWRRWQRWSMFDRAETGRSMSVDGGLLRLLSLLRGGLLHVLSFLLCRFTRIELVLDIHLLIHPDCWK